MKTLTISLVLFFTLTLSTFAVAQTLKTNQAEMTLENEDGNLVLKWKTEREVNSSYFIIEKSNDGKNFSTLAVRKASGNSLFPRSYEFSLTELESFVTYRVRLVTMDGMLAVSNTIALGALNNELISSGIVNK